MRKENKQIAGLVAAGALALATAFLPSPEQVEHTKESEGLRTHAYRDSVGVPTICYGSTRKVYIGQKATLQECEERLQEDLTYAGKGVAKLVQVKLTQGQYDALVDFTFNLGETKLRKSTLLRKLNAEDYCGAAAEFDRWVYAKNAKTGAMEKLPGLVKRRAGNRKMFEEGLVC